mmetsp:Transcript_96707/g.273893  ORF Transcript_96707/g.273893 Transcript_96707/m.273893 type:complete len:245 (+) Transcript_96707:374-1108(+)
MDELLDPREPIFFLVCHLLRGPRRLRRRGTPVPANALRRLAVHARQLQSLDAPGRAEVAFVEFELLVQVQVLHELAPPVLRAGGHGVDDERRPVQPREAEHVLVDVLVRPVQLRYEQVEQQDDGEGQEQEDGPEQHRVLLDVPVVALVEANGDREQRHDRAGHVAEVAAFHRAAGAAHDADRAPERQEQETQRREELSHLRDHVAADQQERGDLGGEHGQVDEDQPVDGHRRHGEDRVPVRQAL